jgi:hypothetical protein
LHTVGCLSGSPAGSDLVWPAVGPLTPA